MDDLITMRKVFIQPIVCPKNWLKGRGYRYVNVTDLLANLSDPELRVPVFTGTVAGTKHSADYIRQKAVEWIKEIVHGDNIYSQEPGARINIACLAIELLDRVMLSMETISKTGFEILTLTCIAVAGKYEIDHFNPFDQIADYFNWNIEALKYTERELLKRLDWSISSRFSVMWFVDYLGGFSMGLSQRVVKLAVLARYLSGAYRLNDPYSVAAEIIEELKLKLE